MIRQSQSCVGKSRNKLPREVFYRDLHIGEFISIQWLAYMKNLHLQSCRTVAWEGGRR
jgi:hypothetical protein